MIETRQMDGWLKELLSELRQGLEELYGVRLKGFYLYGSRSRGEAQPESDVDVLIVLDEIEHYYGELERTAEVVSDLSLRYDVTVSRVLISESQWDEGDEPFLLTVRQDAVAA
jgi:predicted nucleotidyltransferase